jgi:hypothetical protein
MDETSFEKDEDFCEYKADAILGYADDKELHLIFAKLKNVDIELEGGETYLCQINLPVKLLDFLPSLHQSVKSMDGKIHQFYMKKSEK